MRPERMRLIVAVLVAACGAVEMDEPDGPRYRAEKERISFVAPEGWSESRDRDALVFTQGRGTIAIRSVAVEGDWSETRTASLVFPATERWLRGLPRAYVTGPVALPHKRFEARGFYLTFYPQGATGQYERHHVTLVGRSRVVHVVHTAPTGHLDATEIEFNAVIASLREEG